jgi:hypothetical protein
VRKRQGAVIGTWLGMALAGVSLSACVVAEPGDGKSAAAAVRLRGTPFPADFKFGMTRRVDLTVSANPALFHGRPEAGLEVRSADGSLVFKGPMAAAKPLNLHLVVPTKDNSVEVTFRNRDVEQKSVVALAANAATHTFQ